MKTEKPKHNELSHGKISKENMTVELIAGHILAEEYVAAKECLKAYKNKDTADMDFWTGYKTALEHVLLKMQVDITRPRLTAN